MRTIEDALEVLNTLNSQGRIEYAAYSELYDTIAMIETEPVKHGHWIEQEHCDWVYSKECRCSECGKYRLMTNPFGREWNYCPNCGAHMGVEDGVERK